MTRIVLFFVMLITGNIIAQNTAQKTAQNIAQEEVKRTIEIFFDGFHKGDTTLMKSVMMDKFTTQTAYKNKEGEDFLVTEESTKLIDAIANRPLDQMIYHASSVVRAVDRALVVVDLPFGSYQSDPKEALRSAIRIMKESGGHAVKMEGGKEVKESIKRILNAGIPVMGHLGLTPQSIYKFGTYTVRAKEEQEAHQLKEDALMLERVGCFSLVLEKIPAKLAKEVAESVSIPVIGIGAGKGVDGQVLVLHDMLGMTYEFNPRFLRRYMNLYEDMTSAISQYVTNVKDHDFPNDEEQY